MADRTAASVFGRVFEMLASDPTEQHKQWAKKIYEMSKNFDFDDYQMYCDQALVVLGLRPPD